MKKFVLFLMILLSSFLPVIANDSIELMPSQIAKVIKLHYEDSAQEGFEQTKQVVTLKFLTGENKNEIIVLDNQLSGNPFYDIKLKENMKVVLHAEKIDNKTFYSIENVYRLPVLVSLIALFALLLCIIGRKKGIYSLITIFVIILIILKMLSPMIQIGINPILSTIFASLLSTVVTMFLVGGFNRKSTSAVIGCFVTLLIASLLACISVKAGYITGFTDENSNFLYAVHPEINFVSIAVSMMIIAALGAVMDVSMSIASTINEIYSIDNTKTLKELFISGMNVGRDIIGTMANTLILVYLGTSLSLILLLSNIDLYKFINLNQITTEIISALIGTIAIIICVPITAFFAAKLIVSTPSKIDVPFEKL